jgi:hypothetical protein
MQTSILKLLDERPLRMVPEDQRTPPPLPADPSASSGRDKHAHWIPLAISFGLLLLTYLLIRHFLA